MVTVPDHDLPALIRAANAASATDTRLFSLIDELAERENHRDALLDRMLIDESDVIEAAAKKACDVARAIYERIAAIKPTTRAGVLRQLELAARGWVSSWTVPMAIAALREIADCPRPFKVGRLPSVPPATGSQISQQRFDSPEVKGEGTAIRTARISTEPVPAGCRVRNGTPVMNYRRPRTRQSPASAPKHRARLRNARSYISPK